MHLFVQFPHFSNTAAIDRYIEGRLKALHRRLDSKDASVVTLRGMVVGRKTDGSPKKFQAELLVKIPRKKAFVVKKQNSDFRAALSDAADAMETVLRKETETKDRRRKGASKRG